MEEWLNLLSSSQTNLTELILASDVGVDYQNLENLLKAQLWKAADEETTRVMLKVAKREQQGWLNNESIQNFPCTDLGTIDQLWVKYSDGHFGFSVQKRIWQVVKGTHYANQRTYINFCKYVGWYNKSWLLTNQLTFSTNSPEGHLPGCLLVWLWESFENKFENKKDDWWDIISSLSSKLTNCDSLIYKGFINTKNLK
nr:GUN4 domain-containing protein [Nostoc sp. WHI]